MVSRTTGALLARGVDCVDDAGEDSLGATEMRGEGATFMAERCCKGLLPTDVDHRNNNCRRPHQRSALLSRKRIVYVLQTRIIYKAQKWGGCGDWFRNPRQLPWPSAEVGDTQVPEERDPTQKIPDVHELQRVTAKRRVIPK